MSVGSSNVAKGRRHFDDAVFIVAAVYRRIDNLRNELFLTYKVWSKMSSKVIPQGITPSDIKISIVVFGIFGIIISPTCEMSIFNVENFFLSVMDTDNISVVVLPNPFAF